MKKRLSAGGILLALFTITALTASSPATKRSTIPLGSKYRYSEILKGDLPSNDNSICQVAFPLCDSSKAEDALVYLRDLGWHGLMIVFNKECDSLAVYPIVGGGMNAPIKYAYRNRKYVPIIEGCFNFYEAENDPLLVSKQKTDSIIDDYVETLNLSVVEKEMLPIMQFPGENIWQVTFSFAYDTK